MASGLNSGRNTSIPLAKNKSQQILLCEENWTKYLPLTSRVNICSASYQLSFFRSDLWPKREMHKSGLSHFLSHYSKFSSANFFQIKPLSFWHKLRLIFNLLSWTAKTYAGKWLVQRKKSSFVNYFYRLTGSSHMPLNRTAKEICTKFIRNAILHSSFAIFVTRVGVS